MLRIDNPDERSAGAIKFTRPQKNSLQEYDLVRNAALEGGQGPAFIQLYDFYLNQFKELATYSFMSLDSSGHNKFFEFAYEINRTDLIGKYLALIFQSRIKGEEYCANFYAVEDIYQLIHPIPEPVEPFNRKIAVKNFRQQLPDGPQIGDEFNDRLKDGSRGPTMVVLPVGSFHMGSIYGEYDEQPIHRVTISRPIAMMKYEVTFDDWDKCVTAKKCNIDRHEHHGADEGWGRDNRPLINVTMENVKNYALWLSEQTSKRYRLPSEAEWEFAALGGGTSESPLGDTLGQASVNTAIPKCCNVASSTKNQWEYTAPVGSFEANEFGLHDLYGNVSEFVSDCYHKNYQGGPTDGSAWMGCNTESYGLHRVVRGGHFRTEQNKLRSTTRSNTNSAPSEQTGFRLVQEL